MAVQPGLCQTWSETPRPVFSQRGLYGLKQERSDTKASKTDEKSVVMFI